MLGSTEHLNLVALSMSMILSPAGDGISDDLLAREGYRQVARVSGKEVVRIFGARRC